jgi:hypothetical protein
LVDVWLYRNDRQIKQVSYREEAHDPAGQRVPGHGAPLSS